MPDTESKRLRAWAEVDLDALRGNLEAVKRVFPNAGVIAVVKADAYGHGLPVICQTLAPAVSFFGVAALTEAIIAAQAIGRGEPPILLLGASLQDEMEFAIYRGWHLSISTLFELQLAAQLAVKLHRKANVHLIVDTGMGRIGALEADFAGLCTEASENPHVVVAGIASHLPSADEDAAYTTEQLARFHQHTGHRIPAHILNSAGVLGFSTEGSSLIRPGLALYGVSPLPEHQSQLRPVMTLKTRVRLVRRLPAGHGISYGRTFITERETDVATLGIGYGDGYPRSLSGQGAEVLIRGKRCPVLGRVTMDQIMVDVTSLNGEVRVGDEVVLFGPHGITIREIAEKAGTIPWEIMTGITNRVLRIYRG